MDFGSALLLALGALLVIAGVMLLCFPAGLIVAGLLVLVVGVLTVRVGADEQDRSQR